MIKFEKDLLERGYLKFRLTKNNTYIRVSDEEDFISGVDDGSGICKIDYRYFPNLECNKNEEIVVGLLENHKYPTLVSPIPRVCSITEEGYMSSYTISNSEIDRILNKIPIDDLLKILFNKRMFIDIKELE